MHGAVNLWAAAPVDGAWTRIGQALWPPRCLLCREPGADGRDLCKACATRLPWNTAACPRCALPVAAGETMPGPLASACGACLRRAPPLDAVRAAFIYGFPIDRLLPRLKFHGDLAAGRLLAAAMAARCADMPRPDALLPLPLARARLRRRGYDQALELARPVARRLGIPLRDGALVRRRDTAPQSTLDAAARRRNLLGAFAVPPGARLPTHVALVDDVMTTGATLHAAAHALRRAGVARVDAWICARAP
jgi:ComF family protein